MSTPAANNTGPARVLLLMTVTLLMGGMLHMGGTLQAQWKEVKLDPVDMAEDLDEAMTFMKYPTYPQYVSMMGFFAKSYPEICRLDTFGTSEQGRLLLAMKISDQAAQDEPEARFLYTSTMHGDELVGYPLMLRLIDYLLSNYGTDTEVTSLVDNLEIWINPMSNPDGTYYNDNDASVALSLRETSTGVDMNRDFPDITQGEADDTTGRAKETRLMMQFLRKHRFTMSANLHSGAEVVNYPWDHKYALHVDDNWFRFVSREYTDEAKAVDPDYMDQFTDGITNGAAWYRIYNGRQDYVTWYLGGREITLELSHAYRLDSEFLDLFWQINQRSFLNYMAQCMYGITGEVTDLVTGDPLEATVRIPGYDSAYSVARTTAANGDYHRPIEEGTYDLVASAPGYLDDTITGVAVTRYATTRVDFRLRTDSPSGMRGIPGEWREPYPNPFSGAFYIEPGEGGPGNSLPGTTTAEIWSLTGVLMHTQTILLLSGPVEIRPGKLDPGLYILRVSGPEASGVFKIRKQ